MVLNFNNFVKTFKKTNSGVAPEPVDFRMGIKQNDGVSPEPVDFRMGFSKKPKKKVNENHEIQDFTDHDGHNYNKHNHGWLGWLLHNDNLHLATKGKIRDHWGETHTTGSFEHLDLHSNQVSSILSKKLEKISKKHRHAVNEYTKQSAHLNNALIAAHKGGNGIPKAHEDNVKLLDDVTRRLLGHNLHVYSGVKFDPSKHIDGEGHLHLPSYTSTTHHKPTADDFTSHGVKKGFIKHKHILHIYIKHSDHAAHVSHISEEPQEHETILPRHTILHIEKKPTVLGDKTHIWHATIAKQKKIKHISM